MAELNREDIIIPLGASATVAEPTDPETGHSLSLPRDSVQIEFDEHHRRQFPGDARTGGQLHLQRTAGCRRVLASTLL